MSITPKELYDLSDKALLERGGGAQSGSSIDRAIQNEFQRRAYVAQRDAAIAAKEAAGWTKVSAIAICISVIAMSAGVWVDYVGSSCTP